MSDTQLPPPDPDTAPADPPVDEVVTADRVGLTGVDKTIVDPPEEHTVFAPEQPSTIGDGFPVGVWAPGTAATTWIGDTEWAIDPDTRCITGPA